MQRILATVSALALTACLTEAQIATEAVASLTRFRPDAVLLRFPDVSEDKIVFRYDDDLWTVAKGGGTAQRLTTAEGAESMPRFSPDGRSLAFMGGYEGGTDLYVLDVAGGLAERVTHHPGNEVLCDWAPGGRELLYWSSEISGQRRAPRILSVGVDGGMPEPLPVPYGTFGTVDASQTWLAYTMASREFRTWKRYQGGMAQDIWLFNLRTNESRRITVHPGTDAAPMWHGRRVLFVSDRGDAGRMNLYAFDLDTEETTRLTDFTDVDVRFPSIGPEDVVFEAGGRLHRYELDGGEVVEVDVVIPGDRVALRAKTVETEPWMANAHPGPSAKRVVVEARGDLYSVPVESGFTRNLTRTDGIAEREPTWSPDGKWIAYFSDRTGEYELTVRRSDGKDFEGMGVGGERTLTQIGPGWKSNISWSPDSEHLTFACNDGSLYLTELASGATKRIDTEPDGQELFARWSPDSGWLTWSHRHSSSRLGALYLYDVTAGELHEVTSGMFNDSNPVFDLNGDWLYFVSSRTFAPIYEDFGTTWIYTNSANLMAVPLREDVENPWAPENDEEEIEEDEEEDSEEGDSDGSEAEESEGDEAEGEEAASEESESEESADEAGEDSEEDDEEKVEIDLDGFEARVVALDVPSGRVGNLEPLEGKVCFVRSPRTGTRGGNSKLCVFDLEEEEVSTILEDLGGGYVPTAKGDQLLVFHNGKIGVVKAAAGQKFEAIDLDGMVANINPRREWRQLLDDVYRLYRDYFYEDGLHGVDWKGIHDRYVAALPFANSRADVHTFIGEMIAELNVGHAYNSAPRGGLGGGGGSSRPVGLLGCDWELEGGAYRIARILGSEGAYDHDARSPLARHGVDVSVGDYVLEVNGAPINPDRNVYVAFEGTAGRPTELTVNAEPRLDGNERRVLVKPIRSEGRLRYRDWVSRKRAEVERLSGGRVGYVHVPDTGFNGQNELVRQFMGQHHMDALLVDERWNSGGQIPTRFIELLNRDATNLWAVRHGEDWSWPPVAHTGPKAMLINGASGSGGDAFPYYFKQAGLGKLIGRRTWGGLVGISGNPALIDGASPTVPRFAFYELDGTWGVEGHGVDPDIEVIDDPSLMVDGGDPQLEFAVQHLLEELEKNPPVVVPRPANPDRSGSGLRPEDQ